MFYPAPGTLAFSEHLLGLVPIAAPLIALTGPAAARLQRRAHRDVRLSARLAAHFLAYTLTRRHDVPRSSPPSRSRSPPTGSPQVPHIQVAGVVLDAGLPRGAPSLRSHREPRWAILAAAAWLLQALVVRLLPVLPRRCCSRSGCSGSRSGRWPLRQVRDRRRPAFAVGGAAARCRSCCGYQSILRDTYGFKRSIGEIRFFSADVAGLLLASDELLVWGWVHVFQRPESTLFPGLTIVLLAGLRDRTGRSRSATDAARDAPDAHARAAIVVAMLVLCCSSPTAIPIVLRAVAADASAASG